MRLNFLLLVVILGLLIPAPLCAQYRVGYSPLYNYQEEAEPIYELLDLLQEDYTYEYSLPTLYDTLLSESRHYGKKEIPYFTSDVVMARLSNIHAIIPMDYNSYVQRYIDVYTLEKRDRVSKMLGLQNVFFPLFEAELDKQGMPMELKYLSIVESALNPHAKSRAGATGLWQFMLGTAKDYGLRVDSYIDERKDPHKSTLAAISYLKQAHETFGDWLLAIASYNCGPGNVKKAINRAGGVRDFWAIREYLPAETRGYVPAFIAAVYSFTYAEEHNIYPVYPDFSYEQDTLHIKGLNLSLYNIAEMTGASIEELRNLNPELKMDIVPYSSFDAYILRVPHSVSDYFSKYAYSISEKYGRRYYTAGGTTATNVVYYPSSSASTSAYSSDATTTTPYASTPVINSTPVAQDGYVYTSGTTAAAQHGTVTPQGNPEGYIAVGTVINNFENYGSPSESQEDIERNTKIATKKSSETKTTPAKPSTEIAKYHKVVKGDSLWEIAQKYGTTVEALRKLNGAAAKTLVAGDKLRIK